MTEAELQAADAKLYARSNNIRIGYKGRHGGATLEAVITVSKAHFGEGFYALGGSWCK